MVDKQLPADLSKAEIIFPSTPVATGEESFLPTQSFASFMQQGQVSPLATAGKTPMISPFALMQGQPPLAQAPTLETLMAQVNGAQSTLGDLSNQFNTPNLKLKASQKYLLKNKLSDAATNLRAANAKMGAEADEEPDTAGFTGPFGRFLAYLYDGQNLLASAKTQLQNLKDKGSHITPGDFLLIQVKINKAQQELEFSSVLLSNAVSDIKQMMQIQL